MSTETDWKQQYEDLFDFAEETNQVLGDAVATAGYWRHRVQVMMAVTASGFHPLHPPGVELVDDIHDQLEDGTLEIGDINRDFVWIIANVRGLETDLTPIL